MTSVAVVRQDETAVAVIEPHEPRDLAALSEPEFGRALERIRLNQVRMSRILEAYMIKDAHYGIPEQSGFRKPILYRAGAEELRKGFRLALASVEPHEKLVETAEYVSVTVYRAILDISGRELGRVAASCSTKEKRFKRRDGRGYIYDDAREVLHDCRQMAEKRAEVMLVRGALGLTAFLANEEEMEAGLTAEGKPDKALVPWTKEEKRRVYDAAAAVGIGRQQFAKLVLHTLGRESVGTGEDVRQLLQAIAEISAERRQGPRASQSGNSSNSDELALDDPRPVPHTNALREG